MPVTPTYPGVYIEEVPSGVRTITAVATAITAFIGRAPRGAVNEPVRIQNYGDYTRVFGGLSLDSTISYSVQHFFNNGGTDAIIVRAYEKPAATTGIATRILGADMRARGTLTLTEQPSNDEVMHIDAKLYTFKTTLPDEATDGFIHIGENLAATRSNIIGAINLSGNAGTDYAASTTVHPTVAAAAAWVGNDLLLVAKSDGIAGNAITTTETFQAPGNSFDDVTLGATTLGRKPTGAVAAKGTLTIGPNQPAPGEHMTIGAKTYTFEAHGTLTDVDGNIEIGTTIAETRTNIRNAINLEGTPGTGYAASMAKNTDVTAGGTGVPASAIVLTAITIGATGNSIPLGEDFADDANGFDSAHMGVTLAGVDGAAFPSLGLSAANPGAWANNLRVTIDHDIKVPTDVNAFNITIAEVDPSLPASAPPVSTEKFFNVSVDVNAPLHVDKVLESRSQLLRVTTTSNERPGVTAIAVALVGGNDGQDLTDNTICNPNLEATKAGLWALENADLFNILCIPPLAFGTDIGPTTRDAALQYCKARRAFYIVDPPESWTNVTAAERGVDTLNLRDENAAVYFPRVNIANPLRDNQLTEFVPCGVVAGLYARTDARRGVWKAPAGTEATMSGVRTFSVPLTDGENGRLNPLGVNCLRSFPVTGNVIWGARTLEGADQLASEWKYIPVRRTALNIEETLYRALQWVVFEPNDEPLWAQIRLNVGSFMHTLFRQGAFQGSTPKDAYLVKCDSETTTQADIDRGVVNILVGFAPLKPAEFVFVRIQQLAGQLQT